jgi:hypothetical protein
MSRPKFLADHDFNDNIVRGVIRKEPAVQIIRAREVALDKASDAEVLAYAERNKCIVLSHDVNTMPDIASAKMLAGELLSGLILVQQKTPIAAVIEDLILIWAASEAEEWQNNVRFLPL